MNKSVALTLDEDYTVIFYEDTVEFMQRLYPVVLPIEVFYQMWNSDEMMNHMEAYHKRRQENATNP